MCSSSRRKVANLIFFLIVIPFSLTAASRLVHRRHGGGIRAPTSSIGNAENWNQKRSLNANDADGCSLAVCPVCAPGEMQMLPKAGGCCPICRKPDCTVCETGYFDGCNSCSCGSPIAVCTLAFCTEDRAEPRCEGGFKSEQDEGDEEELIETDSSFGNPNIDCSACSSGEYFNGCGHCTCSENLIASCTAVSCETPSEPYCMDDDYDEEGSEDVSIGDVSIGGTPEEPAAEEPATEMPGQEQQVEGNDNSSSSRGYFVPLVEGVLIAALQLVLFAS